MSDVDDRLALSQACRGRQSVSAACYRTFTRVAYPSDCHT